MADHMAIAIGVSAIIIFAALAIIPSTFGPD